MQIQNHGTSIEIDLVNSKSYSEIKRLGNEGAIMGLRFTHDEWLNDNPTIIDKLSKVIVDDDELIGLIDQIDLIVSQGLKKQRRLTKSQKRRRNRMNKYLGYE